MKKNNVLCVETYTNLILRVETQNTNIRRITKLISLNQTSCPPFVTPPTDAPSLQHLLAKASMIKPERTGYR